MSFHVVTVIEDPASSDRQFPTTDLPPESEYVIRCGGCQNKSKGTTSGGGGFVAETGQTFNIAIHKFTSSGAADIWLQANATTLAGLKIYRSDGTP